MYNVNNILYSYLFSKLTVLEKKVVVDHELEIVVVDQEIVVVGQEIVIVTSVIKIEKKTNIKIMTQIKFEINIPKESKY